MVHIPERLDARALIRSAEQATKHLTATELREAFDDGVIKRKDFCKAFDVGESTLSAWLQDGRIPRPIAAAFYFWLRMLDTRTRAAADAEALAEPLVIRIQTSYGIVVRETHKRGGFAHHLVAQGIEDEQTAYELAGCLSHRWKTLRERVATALYAYAETYEDGSDREESWVHELAGDLENFQYAPVRDQDLVETFEDEDTKP